MGDQVLDQNYKAKTRSGKRMLSEIPSFCGSIIEKKDLNYKSQYVTDDDDDDEHCIYWFPLSQISSFVKRREIPRNVNYPKTHQLQHKKRNNRRYEIMNSVEKNNHRWKTLE